MNPRTLMVMGMVQKILCLICHARISPAESGEPQNLVAAKICINALPVEPPRLPYFPQLQLYHNRLSLIPLSLGSIWHTLESNLPFIAQAAFWQSGWFRAFAALGLLGLGLLVYRWRILQLRRRVARQELFARELLNAQERERRRIVADLHDGLGQSLIVIKRRALQGLDKAEDPDLVLEQMQEIAEASTAALDEVRDIIFNLRPPQLEQLGLTGAIAALLERAAQSNDWRVKKQLDEMDGIFALETETSLYRIVQECLANVSKHAAATEVTVRLIRQQHAVELIVQDNGRGVQLSKIAPSGFGWRGLEERASLLSGKLTITSTPGQGTSIRLVLPLKSVGIPNLY